MDIGNLSENHNSVLFFADMDEIWNGFHKLMKSVES